MRIRWTTLALDDLKLISVRIERQHNLVSANRVCRAIYNTVQILRRCPDSGKTGIEEGTREFVVPKLPYIVAYRVLGSGAVEILRIWHGAQAGMAHRMDKFGDCGSTGTLEDLS